MGVARTPHNVASASISVKTCPHETHSVELRLPKPLVVDAMLAAASCRSPGTDFSKPTG